MSKRRTRRRNRKSKELTIPLSPETRQKLLSGQQKSRLSVLSPTSSVVPSSLRDDLKKYSNSDSVFSTFEKQWQKLEKELNNIKNTYDHELELCPPFEKARWLIYEGILASSVTLTFNDYIIGNLFSSDIEAREQIRLGGQMLYDEGGMSELHGMHDPLLWFFIPDAFHSTVDFLWDGVGNWLS